MPPPKPECEELSEDDEIEGIYLIFFFSSVTPVTRSLVTVIIIVYKSCLSFSYYNKHRNFSAVYFLYMKARN